MASNVLRLLVLPLSCGIGKKNLITTTTKSTFMTNQGFGRSISVCCSVALPDDLETTDGSITVTIGGGGASDMIILEKLQMRWPLWTEVVQADKPSAKETTTTVIGNRRFGSFGGKYVPETLMACLSKLEVAFKFILQDAEFQAELTNALRGYVGRETPLYFAKRLTDHYKNSNGEGPSHVISHVFVFSCGIILFNSFLCIMSAFKLKRPSNLIDLITCLFYLDNFTTSLTILVGEQQVDTCMYFMPSTSLLCCLPIDASVIFFDLSFTNRAFSNKAILSNSSVACFKRS